MVLCIYCMLFAAHCHLFLVQFSNYIISTLSFYGSFFSCSFLSVAPSLALARSLACVCVCVLHCKSLDPIRNYTQDRQIIFDVLVDTSFSVSRWNWIGVVCVKRASFALSLVRSLCTRMKFSALNSFFSLSISLPLFRCCCSNSIDMRNILLMENRGTHTHTHMYAKGAVLKIAFYTFFSCTGKKNQFQYTMHMYWQPNNTLCIQKVPCTKLYICYIMLLHDQLTRKNAAAQPAKDEHQQKKNEYSVAKKRAASQSKREIFLLLFCIPIGKYIHSAHFLHWNIYRYCVRHNMNFDFGVSQEVKQTIVS